MRIKRTIAMGGAATLLLLVAWALATASDTTAQAPNLGLVRTTSRILPNTPRTYVVEQTFYFTYSGPRISVHPCPGLTCGHPNMSDAEHGCKVNRWIIEVSGPSQAFPTTIYPPHPSAYAAQADVYLGTDLLNPGGAAVTLQTASYEDQDTGSPFDPAAAKQWEGREWSGQGSAASSLKVSNAAGGGVRLTTNTVVDAFLAKNPGVTYDPKTGMLCGPSLLEPGPGPVIPEIENLTNRVKVTVRWVVPVDGVLGPQRITQGTGHGGEVTATLPPPLPPVQGDPSGTQSAIDAYKKAVEKHVFQSTSSTDPDTERKMKAYQEAFKKMEEIPFFGGTIAAIRKGIPTPAPGAPRSQSSLRGDLLAKAGLLHTAHAQGTTPTPAKQWNWPDTATELKRQTGLTFKEADALEVVGQFDLLPLPVFVGYLKSPRDEITPGGFLRANPVAYSLVLLHYSAESDAFLAYTGHGDRAVYIPWNEVMRGQPRFLLPALTAGKP